MKKNKKSRGKRGAQAAPVWPAFLLLGFLFALLVLMIHARAPGGNLDARGLRISAEGRSDASHVLAPEGFQNARVVAAYSAAGTIPETMNHLYCWCGCIERGMRSALECFESTHAAGCDECLQTAEVAWEMTQQGVTDTGAIQREIDRRAGRIRETAAADCTMPHEACESRGSTELSG